MPGLSTGLIEEKSMSDDAMSDATSVLSEGKGVVIVGSYLADKNHIELAGKTQFDKDAVQERLNFVLAEQLRKLGLAFTQIVCAYEDADDYQRIQTDKLCAVRAPDGLDAKDVAKTLKPLLVAGDQALALSMQGGKSFLWRIDGEIWEERPALRNEGELLRALSKMRGRAFKSMSLVEGDKVRPHLKSEKWVIETAATEQLKKLGYRCCDYQRGLFCLGPKDEGRP